jgi:hypothetical protein
MGGLAVDGLGRAIPAVTSEAWADAIREME